MIDDHDRLRALERESLELRGWVQRLSSDVQAGRFTTQHKLTLAGLALAAAGTLGGAGLAYFASTADLALVETRIERNAERAADLALELGKASEEQREYQDRTQRALHRIDRNLVRIADKLRVQDVEEPKP